MKPSHGPDEAEAAVPSPAVSAELALSRARVVELEARLAAAEAAASELRAANEALARELAAVKKAHETALFDWRPRDFGAELPAGVLLNIMDRVPDSKCVESFY